MLSSHCRWRCLTRLDVVVHTKEIGWVVLVFQGDQAIVIGPVSCARDRLALVGDIVAIRVCDQKRLQSFPTFARPLLVLFRFGRANPHRPGKEVPRVLPMRKSSIGDCDAGGSSVPVFEERWNSVRGGTLARVMYE